jgi:dihydropteroate synthase
MKGTPQNMQRDTSYPDIFSSVFNFFSSKLEQLRTLGVNDIIIDPGFGFGKSLEGNYELLQKLADFKHLGCPILTGTSRKSMLYKLLDITAKEALNATTVSNTISLLNGSSILRVHDVKEAKEAAVIYQKLAEYAN